MTALHPHLQDPEKLLADLRPDFWQRFKESLQTLRASAQPLTQGALVGALIGAIGAPLAALHLGEPAQVLAQILGGLGGELLANFIQRFYDAEASGDEAAKQNVLDEILTHLQQESGKSDEMLIALQYLIERVDALAAMTEAWGNKETQALQQQFFWLKPIPADLAEHRRFSQEVKKLLRLRGAQIHDSFALSDEHRADFLVTEKLGFGRPVSTVVQCVSTAQGRADEKMLDPILRRLGVAQQNHRVEYGMIVSDKGLSPSAQSLAEHYGWEVRRYDGLLAGLMDFSPYLDQLVEDFTKPRPESELPALKKYYVDLIAREERGGEEVDKFDLFGRVQQWIDLPGPAAPMMLLGEYGTGKSTFCRKLAFELAQRYLKAQDETLAGKPGKQTSQLRVPLLINLLDFVQNQKLEALITHYLDARCGVDRPRYALFDALNEAGFFVLILDGFDEMAVRVDSATVEKHLYQIEQLAKPANSRVLLTGRPEFFMSKEELERGLWPKSQQILSTRFKNYEAFRLQLWNDDQILAFLNRLVPHLRRAPLPKKTAASTGVKSLRTGQDYFNRIKQIEGFGDISTRAVLLEMIAQTLPLFDEETPVTRPNLYQIYLKRELERQRLKKGRELLLSDDTRFELLQQLAVDSYKTEAAGVDCTAAQALVKPKLLPEEAASAVKTEQCTREFLSCSFLRPGPGDLFIFSHRSFRGYLAAKELMPALLDGSAKPQLIDQDCIGFLAEMMAETCSSEWYGAQVKAALKKDGIPDWITQKQGRYFSSLPDGFPVEVVYVPAGPFVLGAEGEWSLSPQIAVLDRGFWIDKSPVTNEQYQHFLQAHPKHQAPSAKQDWAKPYNWNGRQFPQEAGQHPVVLVSWHDAKAFAEWAGKILPAEQQWEKAARGIDGRRWPWGNEWNLNKCNSASWWANRNLWDYEKEWKPWWEQEYPREFGGKRMTSVVGEFQENASPYGCWDSAGNVWEWCIDDWDATEEGKKKRVLRGGAWVVRPQDVSCAFRYWDGPDFRDSFFGVRCART